MAHPVQPFDFTFGSMDEHGATNIRYTEETIYSTKDDGKYLVMAYRLHPSDYF